MIYRDIRQALDRLRPLFHFGKFVSQFSHSCGKADVFVYHVVVLVLEVVDLGISSFDGRIPFLKGSCTFNLVSRRHVLPVSLTVCKLAELFSM
jgi:hypothetical protein